MGLHSHYSVLGVATTAGISEIRKAYYALAKLYHPDKNPESSSPETWHAIIAAYEILSDQKKREEYDEKIRTGFPPENQFDVDKRRKEMVELAKQHRKEIEKEIQQEKQKLENQKREFEETYKQKEAAHEKATKEAQKKAELEQKEQQEELRREQERIEERLEEEKKKYEEQLKKIKKNSSSHHSHHGPPSGLHQPQGYASPHSYGYSNHHAPSPWYHSPAPGPSQYYPGPSHTFNEPLSLDSLCSRLTQMQEDMEAKFIRINHRLTEIEEKLATLTPYRGNQQHYNSNPNRGNQRKGWFGI